MTQHGFLRVLFERVLFERVLFETPTTICQSPPALPNQQQSNRCSPPRFPPNCESNSEALRAYEPGELQTELSREQRQDTAGTGWHSRVIRAVLVLLAVASLSACSAPTPSIPGP